MSRHLGNLIGNVHAFHHFTKYRVTEITLTMVKEGTLGATVLQDGEGQCEYAVNVILRALLTGETEGVNMQKDDIPFILVTAENVDQYLK